MNLTKFKTNGKLIKSLNNQLILMAIKSFVKKTHYPISEQ